MFFESTSRLYWPLLLSSMLFIILYQKKLPSYNTIKYYILHKSTRTDVYLLLINLLLKTFLFSLIIVSATSMAISITGILRQMFPSSLKLSVDPIEAKVILTLFVFIIGDFLRFSQHVIMHKLAWKIHKLHHSALILTPLTLFRTHPIEALISFSRNTLTHALTISFMVIFLKNQVDVYDFLGVNILGFMFNGALANLRHSPIPISFGVFEYIFISPRMHQIHHSNNPEHFNKNYGVALSIWDLLMGSFYRPKKEESKLISFGITT